MSDAEDRRLAKAWLIGFFEVDKRGHMRDAFFEKGSKQERDARSALANLLYRDALDPPLRRTLAKMFYPYITGPHLDGPPRCCREIRWSTMSIGAPVHQDRARPERHTIPRCPRLLGI